ncbi:MAG: HD domain-containing protein [Thermoplasmata archaeon]
MAGDFKIIHDSIHGSIRLEEPLISILETPEMQRLSNVRQLGMNYLVFPGANHTRFEHSLGVSHLAGQIGRFLSLNDDQIKILRIAGLLHDIGHPPFSHTLEKYIKKRTGLDHVEIGAKIVNGEIDIANNLSWRREKINEIIENNGLDPREIISIFSEKEENDIFGIRPRKKYMQKIINGDLDADQLDYLLRDSHYTGVAYGIIDLQRILNTVSIRADDIVFNEKGLEALESVMVARALMYSSVYFHKTARIAELMLSRAIESLRILDPINLISMNDSELISMLLQSDGYAKEIGLRIKYRRLFKKAMVYAELPENFDMMNIKKMEDEIAYESGAPDGYVLIDLPIEEISMNEPRLTNLDIKLEKDGRIVYLNSISNIVKSLRTRRPVDYSMMVIAEKSYVENVKNVLKRKF